MIDATIVNEYIKERDNIEADYKAKIDALNEKINGEVRKAFDEHSKVNIGSILHNVTTTTNWCNETRRKENYYKVSYIGVMTNGVVQIHGNKRKLNGDWYIKPTYLYSTSIYDDFEASDKFDIVDETNM